MEENGLENGYNHEYLEPLVDYIVSATGVDRETIKKILRAERDYYLRVLREE